MVYNKESSEENQMRNNVFTAEQIQLVTEKLTDFLNQGEVGAMLHAVYWREVADTPLAGDSLTDEQMEQAIAIECQLRNWLLLNYVQGNM